jgi:two-component system sensor histidine kinase PilS (NtrC family)
MSSEVKAQVRNTSTNFWRSLQTLNISRVVVSVVLFVYFNLKTGKEFWSDEQFWFRSASIAYVVMAVAFVLFKAFYRKRFMWHVAPQIAIDIVIISVLYLASGGGKSGLAILYLFPLGGVAILAPLLWGLFFSAVVTLFLLAEHAYRTLQLDDNISISQAGLFGATYFSVVYLLNRLAGNLIRQEELANTRGKELAIQQAINRLVISDMGDGILVVDQNDVLFEINPAAQHMLGIDEQRSHRITNIKLAEVAELAPVANALLARQQAAQANKTNATLWLRNEDAYFVSVRRLDEHVSDAVSSDHIERADRPEFVIHLKLRFVSVSQSELMDLVENFSDYTIIFMQNVSDIENQAQQLKLASMGRLTASIAHEVRNPLSSISYAASLLNEDVKNEVQTKRLLKIVDDNVLRLNQLIEDILKLSRKAQADVLPFDLIAELKSIVQDFVETRNLPEHLIKIDDADTFKLIFDLGHLREVVVNLLSNAVRYASGQAGSIRLYVKINISNRRELHILDDGPGIPSAVRSHLFEPFYTTSSKGTGLGLYMARELCLNNKALLDYEYRNDDLHQTSSEPTGRFVINFSLPERP